MMNLLQHDQAHLPKSDFNSNELCRRNRRDKLGKLSVLTGVYHDQENQNL